MQETASSAYAKQKHLAATAHAVAKFQWRPCRIPKPRWFRWHARGGVYLLCTRVRKPAHLCIPKVHAKKWAAKNVWCETDCIPTPGKFNSCCMTTKVGVSEMKNVRRPRSRPLGLRTRQHALTRSASCALPTTPAFPLKYYCLMIWRS